MLTVIKLWCLCTSHRFIVLLCVCNICNGGEKLSTGKSDSLDMHPPPPPLIRINHFLRAGKSYRRDMHYHLLSLFFSFFLFLLPHRLLRVGYAREENPKENSKYPTLQNGDQASKKQNESVYSKEDSCLT